MAVWVYKKGDDGKVASDLIDALHLPSALSSGWAVEKSGVTVESEEPTESPKSLDLEMLREEAKIKGVEDYEKKRTSTLLRELGYDDKDRQD